MLKDGVINSPAIGVIGLKIANISLDEWLLIATFPILALQGIYLIVKIYTLLRRKKNKKTRSTDEN